MPEEVSSGGKSPPHADVGVKGADAAVVSPPSVRGEGCQRRSGYLVVGLMAAAVWLVHPELIFGHAHRHHHSRHHRGRHDDTSELERNATPSFFDSASPASESTASQLPNLPNAALGVLPANSTELRRIHRMTTRVEHLTSPDTYLGGVTPDAHLRYDTRPEYFNGAKPFMKPAGWKAPGCGLGPPPDRVTLEGMDLSGECREALREYDAVCGGASGQRKTQEGAQISDFSEPHLHRPLCTVAGGAGQPAYLLLAPVFFGNRSIHCGPSGNTYDVLDFRIDGPNSIEMGFQFLPDLDRPWLQAVGFRPMSPGLYTIASRSHLLHMESPLFFRKRRASKKLGKMPRMGVGRCPLSKCEKRRADGMYKASFDCMATAAQIVVAEKGKKDGGCDITPVEQLPPCHAAFPTEQEDWYGRWVLECGTAETCSAHPIPTRPMDSLREKVKRLDLMRSAAACVNTLPMHRKTKMYTGNTWQTGGGWVWHPHACRPRVFTPKQAWKCLSGKGVLGVGDSVSTTNGHLIYAHMGMQAAEYESGGVNFSQRGERSDELHGDVIPDPAMVAAPEGGSFYFSTMVRQLFFHLETIASDIAGLKAKQNASRNPISSLVLCMGLHDTVKSAAPVHREAVVSSFHKAFVERRGGPNGGYPIIFHPNTASVLPLMCTKKNPHRVQQVNSAYASALRYHSSRGDMPPVAITPSYFMARSMNWEVPSMDDAGSHPYCSFVGLSMWNSVVDLMCPSSEQDTFAKSPPVGSSRAPSSVPGSLPSKVPPVKTAEK